MHCQLSRDLCWLVTTTSVVVAGGGVVRGAVWAVGWGSNEHDVSFTWINGTSFIHKHTTPQTWRNIVAPWSTEEQRVCVRECMHAWVGECVVSGGLPQLCHYVSCLLLISANSPPPPLIFQQGRFYRFVFVDSAEAKLPSSSSYLSPSFFYPSPLPGAIWPCID